jgi:hypothetical protein
MSDALDNAAAAALFMMGLTHPTNIENMGAIYSKDDGFGRSNIVSSGQGAHVKGTIAIPPGSLAALFHNHPTARADSHNARLTGGADQFSPDDIAQAQRLGKPSYISTPSGKWLRFDPKANTTEEVLAEFPINELLAHIAGRSPFAAAAQAARVSTPNPMTAALEK